MGQTFRCLLGSRQMKKERGQASQQSWGDMGRDSVGHRGGHHKLSFWREWVLVINNYKHYADTHSTTGLLACL